MPILQDALYPCLDLALLGETSLCVVSFPDPTGAHSIVNSGLIPSMVWKLQKEQEFNQVLLLDVLASCLMEDATSALNTNVVLLLKEKLTSPNDEIRMKAAHTLTAIRWGFGKWGRLDT